MAAAAPTDIFGRVPLNFAGSFSADSAIFTFGTGGGLAQGGGTVSGGGVGLLTQQVSYSYQQNITRLYEIGTRNVFMVVGRSAGQASAQRVLGPRPIILSFYATYGSACLAATNNLTVTLASGCTLPGDYGNTTTFTMLACVITAVSYSTTAESMIISESLQMMFVSLLMSQP